MKFDIAIIGGGPGGYTAAEKAAKAGRSVVLFEKEDLGGTCHAGAAPKRPEPDEAYEPTKEEARRAAFQSDVLRGVIMSEILTRPGERAAVKRMKRGR